MKITRQLTIVCVAVMVVSMVIMGCGPTETPPTETPPTSPQVYTLKFATHDPVISVYERCFVIPWIKLIERETEGRVIIEHYPSQTLVKKADMHDAILTGVADFVYEVSSNTPGEMPITELVSNIPFMVPSATSFGLALWDALEMGYLGEEWKDEITLGMRCSAPKQISHRTKYIKTMEDWKGQKFDGRGSLLAEMGSAMNATPVGVGGPEVYDALQKGLIDFCILEWEGLIIHKNAEVTKYRTSGADIISSAGQYAMSLNTYKELPDDIKAIIDKYSGEYITKLTCANMDRENIWRYTELLAHDEKMGNPPIYQLPKEEKARWAEAMTPMIDKVIADLEADGLPARAAFDKVVELTNKYDTMYPIDSNEMRGLWEEFGKDSVFPGYPEDFIMP